MNVWVCRASACGILFSPRCRDGGAAEDRHYFDSRSMDTPHYDAGRIDGFIMNSIEKCRCGAVEVPVLPTSATT
jgi:hypothetical protein